jgi:hypothetical protein
MSTKTLKNKKSGSRVFKYMGSPVPIVLRENTKRGITYKLPINLLQPREVLKAKQKNKVNRATLANEVRRSQAIEAERQRLERIESQARFAAMLRAERERHAKEEEQESFRRGPGARGLIGNMSGTRTIRKANKAASKGKALSTLWGNLNSK